MPSVFVSKHRLLLRNCCDLGRLWLAQYVLVMDILESIPIEFVRFDYVQSSLKV